MKNHYRNRCTIDELKNRKNRKNWKSKIFWHWHWHWQIEIWQIETCNTHML